MVASATDIVSLERVRYELRIPDHDTDHDSFLEMLINSAVHELEADLGFPLINKEATRTVVFSQSDTSIRFREPLLRTVTSVEYQSPATDAIRGLYPSLVTATGWAFSGGVLYPRGGWPDAAFNSYRLTAELGIVSNDPLLHAYSAAAVLLIRSMYNGDMMVREDSAYERLIRPLRRLLDFEWTIIGPGSGQTPEPEAGASLPSGTDVRRSLMWDVSGRKWVAVSDETELAFVLQRTDSLADLCAHIQAALRILVPINRVKYPTSDLDTLAELPAYSLFRRSVGQGTSFYGRAGENVAEGSMREIYRSEDIFGVWTADLAANPWVWVATPSHLDALGDYRIYYQQSVAADGSVTTETVQNAAAFTNVHKSALAINGVPYDAGGVQVGGTRPLEYGVPGVGAYSTTGRIILNYQPTVDPATCTLLA